MEFPKPWHSIPFEDWDKTEAMFKAISLEAKERAEQGLPPSPQEKLLPPLYARRKPQRLPRLKS